MRVLFRCDGGVSVGLGHVSRSLALAEGFREYGAEAVFAGRFGDAGHAHIRAAGFPIAEMTDEVNEGGDMGQVRQAIAAHVATCVVVDSYRVDEAYLQALKAADSRVVVIDDFRSLRRYDCDVVLNFTVGASASGYPSDGPVLLLGPEYLLCRRRLCELRAESLARSREDNIGRLLVAIAGEDPTNLTGRVVSILAERHSGLSVRTVSGRSFPWRQETSRQLAVFAAGSGCSCGLPDLAEPLVWADACIAGGGLIKYEAAFMGVPVAVLSQNAGQAAETKEFVREGLAFDLGLAAEQCDAELLAGMAGFVTDLNLRRRLAMRGREVFPENPARRAAAAIIRAVQG